MKTKEIAEWLSAELVGDGDVEITGFGAIDTARPGDIAFLANAAEISTAASAVIVPLDFELSSHVAMIKVADPKLAFAQVASKIIPTTWPHGWHETAIVPEGSDVRAGYIGAFVSIGSETEVGDSSAIHAGVRIGENVTIGKCSIIHANCVIYDGSTIGNDCVIHAGTVIGSDGFGYVKNETGEHLQFPQAGSVVIEDNVEIGANCTIDRGSLGETRIGEGTKIDNLVHIAHNVVIGKRVLIAGQSGIAGSSTIEDDVVIAGQVGIADHVTVKAGAIIGAKSSVFPNKVLRRGFWSGIPVEPIDDYRRKHVMLNRMLRRSSDDEEAG